MDYIFVKIKNNLKDQRIRHNVRQRECAQLLKCTVSAYSQYETGQRIPSIDKLSKLAEFYRVTVDDLIGSNEIEL